MIDITNASGTGLYDPFVKQWGLWAVNVLKIPTTILPQIVANDFDFGKTDSSIFGAEIPIKCMVSHAIGFFKAHSPRTL